jgi:hypothetical protein
MIKVLFELLELICRQNQFCLHFGRDLLEKLKFFNDKIVIIEKSLVDVLFDVIVKIWLNMEGLV